MLFDFSGTEPWHFYFVNGILNFNLVFALALFSLPLTALMETLLHRFNGEDCVCVSYTSTKKKRLNVAIACMFREMLRVLVSRRICVKIISGVVMTHSCLHSAAQT